MLERAARRRLLLALAITCPRGPILMSFQSAAGRLARPGRADLLGRLVGAPAGWMRRVGAARAEERFWIHSGFFERLSAEEISRVAGEAGRIAVYAERPYPHATLMPDEKLLSKVAVRAAVGSHPTASASLRREGPR